MELTVGWRRSLEPPAVAAPVLLLELGAAGSSARVGLEATFEVLGPEVRLDWLDEARPDEEAGHHGAEAEDEGPAADGEAEEASEDAPADDDV